MRPLPLADPLRATGRPVHAFLCSLSAFWIKTMSYRAFKRLLGETSLERKSRFLFGAGILLLITGSFWLYASLTENLAYKQTETTFRVLVQEIVKDVHFEKQLKQL